MLSVLFSNGSILLLNIASPHTIYVRDQSPANSATSNLTNGKVINNGQTKIDDNKKQLIAPRLFGQCNGQIIEISSDRVMTKSVFEYFIENK